MRVAFSGAHRTGKTTLIEAVSAVLPAYDVLDEPYRLLEDEGYEFSDPPTREDFECQLRQSLDIIADCAAEVLIDRCPLDFVAYLQALDDGFEIEDWLDDIRACMEMLDLVVVVPIEMPDRIAVASHEDRLLRRRVDERLRALVLDDPHGLGTRTIEVTGTLEERARQVARSMR